MTTATSGSPTLSTALVVASLTSSSKAIRAGCPTTTSVTFRSWTGRETMRLGDLKAEYMRPEARLTPDPIEDQIAALGLGGDADAT
jgi:hypothetical protein